MQNICEKEGVDKMLSHSFTPSFSMPIEFLRSLSKSAGLDVDLFTGFDRNHLHEAAARADIEELKRIPVGQFFHELLLVAELGDVLCRITAVAVEDDKEIRPFGDILKGVLTGFFVCQSMIDRGVLRNLIIAIPVIELFLRELVIGEILTDEPDIGLLVMKFMLRCGQIPADTAGRGVRSRGNLHAALGAVRVDSTADDADRAAGLDSRQGHRASRCGSKAEYPRHERQYFFLHNLSLLCEKVQYWTFSYHLTEFSSIRFHEAVVSAVLLVLQYSVEVDIFHGMEDVAGDLRIRFCQFCNELLDFQTF